MSTGIFPASAQSLPRSTSPKRNGNAILAALRAGLAPRGTASREASAPATFAGPEMLSLFPRRGAACLARQPNLSAHQTWVLQVLEPGAVWPGGMQLLGCCIKSATSISPLGASSSTRLFLGHGGY